MAPVSPVLHCHPLQTACQSPVLLCQPIIDSPSPPCAAAVLASLCDSHAKANTMWLYIKTRSSSQGIRICTLVMKKGAAHVDRHSEEPIMKALRHIYDFIARESIHCIARSLCTLRCYAGLFVHLGCACMQTASDLQQ